MAASFVGFAPASVAAAPSAGYFAPASTSCPANTQVFVPNAAHPDALPAGMTSADAYEINRMNAEGKQLHDGQAPTWLTTLQCGQSTVTHRYSGVAGASSTAPTAAPAPPSENWSGYVLPAQQTTFVNMNWTAPAVNGSNDFNEHDVSIWPGIGGYGANAPLVQAGSDTEGTCYFIVGCFESRQNLWYEALPDEPTEVPINSMSLDDGDQVSVGVVFDYGSHTATFYVCNLTHNTCVAPTHTMANQVDPSPTAEWIVERPDFGGTLHELDNFGNLALTQTEYDSEFSGGGIFGASSITMQTCAGKTMAVPSGISADGSSFTDVWKADGNYDPDPCPSS